MSQLWQSGGYDVLKLLAAVAQRFRKLRLVTLTAVKSPAAQTDLYLQSRVGRTVMHPGELPATQGFGSCFSASAASVRSLGAGSDRCAPPCPVAERDKCLNIAVVVVFNV